MGNLSSKIKIYITLAVWFLVIGSLFGYFFDLMQSSNQKMAKVMGDKQNELAKLEAEQRGYTQGKEDLERVKRMAVQPGDFFSNDLNFFNTIKVIEGLAKNYDVDLKVGGVSGTIKNWGKIKLNNELFIVPANIVINGTFENTARFIENLEHLGFAKKVNSLAITANGDGKMSTSITLNFFLKQ